MGIDPGAEISVWPSKLHDHVALEATEESKSGVMYWGPSDLTAPSIKNEGKRAYQLDVGGKTLTHRPHICNVRRPLLAVSNLNDNGWGVMSTLEGGWMEHRATETIISFNRVGGRFEIRAKVSDLHAMGGHGPPLA